MEARFFKDVAFIDAGGNWEGVSCSACGADAEPWWSDAMSAAAERGFRDLTATARCCGATISLTELRYHWPVAFGRFVLEAMNPNVSNVSADQQGRLASSIGCPVLAVWARV